MGELSRMPIIGVEVAVSRVSPKLTTAAAILKLEGPISSKHRYIYSSMSVGSIFEARRENKVRT